MNSLEFLGRMLKWPMNTRPRESLNHELSVKSKIYEMFLQPC